MEKLIEILQSYRLGFLYVLKMVPPHCWDWRPEPTMKTTAELATHVAASPLQLGESLRGNIPDLETYEHREQSLIPTDAQGLVALYEEGLTNLISYLQDHVEDAHATTLQLYFRDHKTSIYEEVISEITHQWFHLGQLFVYLRQNQITIDTNTYYGTQDPDPSIPPAT
jgi:uncharacterized damage-inducible protein DinB